MNEQPLDIATKSAILGMYRNGNSFGNISLIMELPAGTIENVITHYLQTGTHENRVQETLKKGGTI